MLVYQHFNGIHFYEQNGYLWIPLKIKSIHGIHFYFEWILVWIPTKAMVRKGLKPKVSIVSIILYI